MASSSLKHQWHSQLQLLTRYSGRTFLTAQRAQDVSSELKSLVIHSFYYPE